MGAGALATILGVLHFLLQNGLATGVIGSNFSEGLTRYGETVGAYGTVSSSKASTYSPSYTGYAPPNGYAPTQLVSYPSAHTQATYGNQYGNAYDPRYASQSYPQQNYGNVNANGYGAHYAAQNYPPASNWASMAPQPQSWQASHPQSSYGQGNTGWHNPTSNGYGATANPYSASHPYATSNTAYNQGLPYSQQPYGSQQGSQWAPTYSNQNYGANSYPPYSNSNSAYNQNLHTTGTAQGYSHTNYSQPYSPNNLRGNDIQVYFSPNGGCTDAILREIQAAQRSVYIQAYSFTSDPILQACKSAYQRGVQVLVVLDKSKENEEQQIADALEATGIPVYIDGHHAIAHNKIMLIDGRVVITGSFNFTVSAEKANAENLVIIRDRPEIYNLYEQNLRMHLEHSSEHKHSTVGFNRGRGPQRY